MAEQTTKHRRWPWMLLAIVVILVVSSVAWQFRPLTSAERHVLGTWQYRIPDPQDGWNTFELTLTEDRHFMYRIFEDPDESPMRLNHQSDGTWRVSDGRLRLFSDDQEPGVIKRLLTGEGRKTWEYQILQTDPPTLKVGSGITNYVRIPDGETATATDP